MLADPDPPSTPSDPLAPVVAVVAAPGADGAAATTAVAASLARTVPRSRSLVLADLALDAPHRTIHGLTSDRSGLPELIAASRFGPPPADLVATAAHATRHGYAVVPGLRRHRDWVSVGPRSAANALAAVRAYAEVVVAHVDRDVEGEADTGSLDVEDRNVLARTGVGSAGLVVVVGGTHRPDQVAVETTIGLLRDFGVAAERLVVLRSPRPRPGRRITTALLAGLDRVLAAPLAPGPIRTPTGDEPRRIEPGTLGTRRQEVDGWMTPSVPQQP